MKKLSPRKLILTKGKLSVADGENLQKYLYDWQLRMGYADVIEVNLLERQRLLDYSAYVKELQDRPDTIPFTVTWTISRPSLFRRFMSFIRMSARDGSAAGDTQTTQLNQ